MAEEEEHHQVVEVVRCKVVALEYLLAVEVVVDHIVARSLKDQEVPEEVLSCIRLDRTLDIHHIRHSSDQEEVAVLVVAKERHCFQEHHHNHHSFHYHFYLEPKVLPQNLHHDYRSHSEVGHAVAKAQLLQMLVVVPMVEIPHLRMIRHLDSKLQELLRYVQLRHWMGCQKALA